ncbi:MAG: hypothetical protein EPN40_14240 [Rhodanobacteraceae bacterium]|nr:MAG: hypothetical protein EPN40_14240 [Rhodanobacteraceae bacterium]
MSAQPLTEAIRIHVRDPWASVPIRLMEASSGLTPESRLALIYMLDLGRRPGWTVYVSHVVRALGLRRDRWRRMRRELEAGGYFHAVRRHGAGGRWAWEFHLTDWPTDDVSTIDGFANDGDADDGKPDDKHNSTLSSSTGLTKREAAARAIASEAQSRPDAASSGGKGAAATAQQKKKPGSPHPEVDGVRVYPSTDDAERLDACRERVGTEILGALVARLPRPVYVSEVEAVVGAYLADRAREAADADRHRRAREPCETPEEASRRAAEQMREYAQVGAL